MKASIRITLFFIFCFVLTQLLFAQKRKGDHKQTYENIALTIEKINRLLGSDCKMNFDEELKVVFFEKGIQFREDVVHLDALDPHNVHYVAEEMAVSIQCLEFKGLKGKLRRRYGEGCIWRDIVKDTKTSKYSRIAFKIVNAQTASELKIELEKLIRYGHELSMTTQDF